MQALRDDDPAYVADYRLLGRLGEGGMGVVYLARSPRGRMVAVKSIRAELAALTDFRLRFAEEVATAQRVGGDWTAAVLDADPHAERPWVATAYVPGPTLAEVVTRHGPLPERSVRGLASGLCDALADIHGAGLVHRDLKPSNIMITIDGPKVIDFGIVRALDSPTHGGLTSSGVIVGSPGFMAPEQVRGERLTAACDIFSLGSVLAFAACGRLPFDSPGARPHALMYRVVHEEPDLDGIPEPLLPLIRDCLAKEPAARSSLTTLRAREETQFRHLGPWLPAPVLARLGQDAAHLLEQEDPRTGSTNAAHPPPVPPLPQDETLPSGSRPPALPDTAPVLPDTAPVTDPDLRQPPAQPGGRMAPPTRTLAEERNGGIGPGPATVMVYVTLTLYAVASLGVAFTQLNMLGDTFEWSTDADELTFPWAIMQAGTTVTLAVAWLIWCSRTRAVAEEFAPGRLRYSPAMAVRSWFIPFGNLYLPKQIADDVWHASSPPSPTGATAPSARLHIWWGCWVFTMLTSPLYYWQAIVWADADNLGYESSGSSANDTYESWYTHELGTIGWLAVVLHFLVVPIVVATALYVSRLTALQQVRRGSSTS
ncbi:protein kinase domain-containing protein [Streptomyces anulatus]|uniref:protein kinase domain-containing protein n=1 Tax=Streptomyces anulatus TaxID=1892 RepID=UPI0033279264